MRHIAERDPQLQSDAKFNQDYEDEGVGTRLVYRDQLRRRLQRLRAASIWSVPCSSSLAMPCVIITTCKCSKIHNRGMAMASRLWLPLQRVLYPDFISLMLALDPCNRENGCLRVLRGSHRLGRLAPIFGFTTYCRP